MAVLHDTRPSAPRTSGGKRAAVKIDPVVTDFLKDTLVDYDATQVSMYNGNPVYASPALTLDKGVAFSCGVTIGEIRKNYIQPHHQFFMAMGRQFKRQIELVRPEVIVLLGATAVKYLLNVTNGISKLRGRWMSYENIPVMATFHPAFLLRQESAKRETWNDLQQVMARFGKYHNSGVKRG